MAGIKEIASGRLDIFKVSPKILQEESGFNLRQEGSDLDQYVAELSEYIKNKGCPGVLTIHMKDGQPFVIDGHCRRRAALLALDNGADPEMVLPCKMVDRYDNDADKIAYLISTNSGRPLTPMEKAGVCRRLHDLGLENKEIAFKTGLSISRVGQLLALLSAPQKVLDMVSRGEISASMASEEIKDNPEMAVEKLETAVDNAKAEGKKRASRKHFEPDQDQDNDPCVVAFESMPIDEGSQKNWMSFKGGWDAAMRYKRR